MLVRKFAFEGWSRCALPNPFRLLRLGRVLAWEEALGASGLPVALVPRPPDSAYTRGPRSISPGTEGVAMCHESSESFG